MVVCEVCGGKLVKQDGLFVCQGCGLGYTLEEMKKMAGTEEAPAAETPAAEAAPPAADREERLGNLRQLARLARIHNDREAEARHCSEIQREAPDDWFANLYAICYEAYNADIEHMADAARRVVSSMDKVLDLIEKQEKKPMIACMDIADYISDLASKLMQKAVDNIGFQSPVSMVKGAEEWMIPAIEMEYSVGTAILNRFEDQPGIYMPVELLYKSVSRGIPFASGPSNARLKEAAQNGLERLKVIKQAEYWKQHAEEKAKLEQEKASLEAEQEELGKRIEELMNRLGAVPGLQEEIELRGQISALETNKQNIGLFKFKERKAVQLQIDDLKAKLSRAEQAVTAQRDEINAEIDPLREKKEAGCKRIDEIVNELAKER